MARPGWSGSQIAFVLVDDPRPWWRQPTGRPQWLPKVSRRKALFIAAVGYALAAVLGFVNLALSHNPMQAVLPTVFGVLAVFWLLRAARTPL